MLIMKYKSKLTIFLIITFTITFCISLYLVIKDFIQYQENNKITEELIDDAIEIDSKTEEPLIDWNYLKSVNDDIVGWIEIENTKINYPILKDDNLKYLNHSFDRKYNSNGSIFTLNDNPFQDIETVVYGHNMKSGLMFSELGKYMNEKFLLEHPDFEIYTQSQNYKATIFSCYSTNVNTEENNIKHLNFEEEIEYYKKKSKYEIGNISEITKIVKLVTCSYLNNHTTPTSERYFIIAGLEEIS